LFTTPFKYDVCVGRDTLLSTLNFKKLRLLKRSMRMGLMGIVVLSILLLAIPVSAVSYDFEVLENGQTKAVIIVDGGVEVSVPSDVSNPEIEGGSYSVLPTGMAVVPDGGNAILSYLSSFHTKKQGGIWYFDAEIKEAESVSLLLPANVQIVQAEPRASIAKNSGVELSWKNVNQDIKVSYVVPLSVVDQEVVPQSSPNWMIVIILGLLLVIAVLIYRKIPAKDPPQIKVDITDGQMHVIRAANDNEALVLKVMIKYNGQIKRNKLEKETQLSKSSLASSLKNLEHKRIVDIDRTFHTHFLTLSDWFKEL